MYRNIIIAVVCLCLTTTVNAATILFDQQVFNQPTSWSSGLPSDANHGTVTFDSTFESINLSDPTSESFGLNLSDSNADGVIEILHQSGNMIGTGNGNNKDFGLYHSTDRIEYTLSNGIMSNFRLIRVSDGDVFTLDGGQISLLTKSQNYQSAIAPFSGGTFNMTDGVLDGDVRFIASDALINLSGGVVENLGGSKQFLGFFASGINAEINIFGDFTVNNVVSGLSAESYFDLANNGQITFDLDGPSAWSGSIQGQSTWTIDDWRTAFDGVEVQSNNMKYVLDSTQTTGAYSFDTYFNVQGSTVTSSSVPEPSTFALMTIGVVILARRKRLNKRASV